MAASFEGHVGANGQDLYVSATFLGGEPFAYDRYVKVQLVGLTTTGYIANTTKSASGDESNWFVMNIITDVPYGTYSYVVTMAYYDAGTGRIEDTSYTDSGSVTVSPPVVDYFARATFDANGGSPTPADVSNSNTSTAVPLTMPGGPANPPSAGYTFGGWLCNGITYQPYNTYNFTGGTTEIVYTMVAIWRSPTPVGSSNSYINIGSPTNPNFINAIPYINCGSPSNPDWVEMVSAINIGSPSNPQWET